MLIKEGTHGGYGASLCTRFVILDFSDNQSLERRVSARFCCISVLFLGCAEHPFISPIHEILKFQYVLFHEYISKSTYAFFAILAIGGAIDDVLLPWYVMWNF